MPHIANIVGTHVMCRELKVEEEDQLRAQDRAVVYLLLRLEDFLWKKGDNSGTSETTKNSRDRSLLV